VNVVEEVQKSAAEINVACDGFVGTLHIIRMFFLRKNINGFKKMKHAPISKLKNNSIITFTATT
jgi:hypothetical protein